ncbi:MULTISPECIES: HNH endonuclease signature motif containing protein [Stenotrophomonas maltophilia group]|uniref:HNH endonuclease signature motif containing protein n=1 Tax=Stenotrophomonas maltophilia group TaxID=995085 RepID=UPI002091A551|nr:HNH endonuclease signature motif containing protein [Stenotrophomonas maltophilia]MCO5738896.1 HNH endonuclease [Stenotrophomonas maltophilia]
MSLTAAAKKISHARLLEVIRYEPETGAFIWKIATSRKTRVGSVMATRSKASRGGVYLQGRIDGRIYRLHRLAWFYMTGSWPANEIDHINGDSTDNRWTNLRDVPRAVNQQNVRSAKRNSKTGLLGVIPARGGKFRAAIRVGQQFHHLGHFDTAEEAHAAYVCAKRRLHEGSTV